MLNIKQNVPLARYSSMRLGGPADVFTEIHSETELVEAITWAAKHKKKFLILGEGSNSIFSDEGFRGLVILNQIKGFKIVEEGEGSTTIEIGAGENWDDVVERTVKLHLSGIEALSAIPGTAGATPVQNVGAYGQEIKDTLVSLRAYDTNTRRFVALSNNDCQFSYRNSIFKSTERGRYAIVSITLKLSRQPMQPPFYESLQNYLDTHHVSTYSPAEIRQAVIAIRAVKLPDPSKLPNNGSFFKNPILSREKYGQLKRNFSAIPGYPTDSGGVKIPAAWLLEQLGYKGYRHEAGIGTHEPNPLVFVNYGATSTESLLKLRNEVTARVKQTYGIELEQEPEFIEP